MAQRIIHILLFFVLFFYCGSKVVGQSFFGKPIEITETYYGTKGLLTADFDGDGLLEIVQFTDQLNGRLVIRYQVSEDVFDLEKVLLRDMYGMQDVILFDVDNDGDTDICVSSTELANVSISDNRVLLIENIGSGAFADPIVLSLPSSISNLTHADLDLDGSEDLVFLMNNEIHWMENIGGGGFSSASLIYAYEEIMSFQLADLNNDEAWDLVGNYYNSVTNARRYFYSVQIGSMQFEAPIIIANAPTTLKDIAVADFNNDNFDECVLQFDGNNGFQIFINDGQGNLTMQESFNILVSTIRVGDFDNNGFFDIAYFEAGTGSQSGIIFNDSPAWYLTQDLGEGNTSGVDAQDINSDGVLDILKFHPLIGPFNFNVIEYYKGINGGLFEETRLIAGSTGGYYFYGDFNLDNEPDLSTLHSSSGETFNYPIKAIGEPSLLNRISTNSGFTEMVATHSPYFIDIDVDMDVDVIYGLACGGNCDGVIIARREIGDTYTINNQLLGHDLLNVSLGNFNNDLYPDLLFYDPNPVPGSENYMFCLNDGTGLFNNPIGLDFASQIEFPKFLKDLDNDNISDLYGKNANNDFYFYKGNGDGTYTTFQTTTLLHQEKIQNFVDFNEDGLLDIIQYDEYSSNSIIHVGINVGDFVFSEDIEVPLNGAYPKVKFLDFDFDGYQDILVSTVNTVTKQFIFNLVRNISGVNFDIEVLYEYSFAHSPFGTSSRTFLIEDIDADGYFDIVFDSPTGQEAFWLRNLTPYCQTFAPTITPDQTICEGESRTLQVSGGGVYNWEFDHFGSSYDVQPDTTTTYNVWVCNDIGCADTLSATVTVLPVAEIEISVIDADLHASPFDNVMWYRVGNDLPLGSGGDYTAVQNGEYYYVYENANGCQQVSDIAVVSFFCQTFAPTISAAQMVCPGSSVMLSAAGGDNYLWPDGSVGDTYEFVANEPTEVQVEISTVNFCSATLSSQIDFFETPELGIIENGPDLVATGAANVEWFSPDNEVALGIGDLFTPAENGYYFVKSESVDGCELVSDTIHFLYFCYLFTPSITPDQTVCPGTSVVIEAQGGDSYQWSNGASGSLLEALPLSNTTYELYVATDNGCSDTLSTSVNLFDLQETQVVFNGSSLEATSGNDITWYETGSAEPLGTGEQFSPNQSGNYYYTSQSENGCAQISDTLSFDFCTTLFAPALIGETTICPGEGATLQVSGGDNYAWSTGFVGDVYEVNPEETTTYEVYITTSGGCADTLTAVVGVSELPQITVAIDGNTINASVSPANANVTWVNALSNEVIGNGLSVVPDENGFYFAITENDDMCTIYSDTLEYLYYGVEVIGSSPLHIYPNPGSDWIMITGEESVLISEVSLLDLGGRQIHASMNTTGSGIYQLPSHLPAGAYIISITCEDDSVLRMMWVRE